MGKQLVHPIELASSLSEVTEIRYTPSGSDITEGELQQINGSYGFSMADVLDGEEGAFIVKAPKVWIDKGSDVIAVGNKVYYDPVNKIAKLASASGYIEVGVAAEQAATGDANVLVVFDGVSKTAAV
jgi:predicted RecA/RadA family phage recombinase